MRNFVGNAVHRGNPRRGRDPLPLPRSTDRPAVPPGDLLGRVGVVARLAGAPQIGGSEAALWMVSNWLSVVDHRRGGNAALFLAPGAEGMLPQMGEAQPLPVSIVAA